MIFDYQFRNYNFRALIYMILLSVLGILVVGSASNQDRSSVIKQIIGVVVSLIICLVLSLIDYHQYFRFTTLIYVVCAGMLAAVLLFGRTTKGATRWLRIGRYRAAWFCFCYGKHGLRGKSVNKYRKLFIAAVRVCKDRSDPHPGEFPFQKPGENQ